MKFFRRAGLFGNALDEGEKLRQLAKQEMNKKRSLQEGGKKYRRKKHSSNYSDHYAHGMHDALDNRLYEASQDC